MSDNQPTGEAIMKQMISVEGNSDTYEIMLHQEILDGLKDEVCDLMIDHMQVYLEAYKFLRSSSKKLEKAKEHIEMIKTDPVPYLHDREYFELPF